jgi:hypothetical protein
MSGTWQQVTKADGPFEGRGGLLGPDTSRRTRWWELDLECGHRVERTVRYRAREVKHGRMRGGIQHRRLSDVLDPPKRVLCPYKHPEPSDTGCPMCGSDDYDTELGPDNQPDYEHGLKTCQECGEEWV